MDELFGREGAVPPGVQVWVGGHLESAEALGQAFLEAADALAEVWRNNHSTAGVDRLAVMSREVVPRGVGEPA